MSGALYLQPPRAIDAGDISPGALLTISDSGDTDPVAIYADGALTTKLPNPLQADAAGRWPSIYPGSGSYRARCVDAEIIEIFDIDPINPTKPFGIDAAPLNDAGAALPFAVLTFYQRDTTILAPIYSSASLGIELDNPLTADSDGVFPDIYLDTDEFYRVLLHDRSGRLIYDIDPYDPAATGVEIIAGTFETAIGYFASSAGTLVLSTISYTLTALGSLPLSGPIVLALTGAASPPAANAYTTLTIFDANHDELVSVTFASANSTSVDGNTRSWFWNGHGHPFAGGPGDTFFAELT